MDDKIKLNEALKKLEDIELALNESSIVAITNQRGIIQFANDKFCQISKFNREELIGSQQNIVNSGYHSRAFFKEMWKTIGTGNVWKGEIKNKAKDGSYYWVDTTIVPFLNDKGKPYQYISIRHDVTKLKAYRQKVKQMAYEDPLTCLPNRHALHEWLQSQAVKDHDMTVLFVDIDRFKAVNDTYGHRIGDMLLKEIANKLKMSLRQTDFIVRQGGDEFIIFLHELINKQDVMEIVNKLLEQFKYPLSFNREQIFVTASIGISMDSSQKEADIDYLQLADLLIKQADTAMYHAKKQGGNTYCFNTTDQNVQMQRYHSMEQKIKKALHQNEFSIVYQPLVHLKNSNIVGVEALLRWHNPQLGSISPVEFIPLLEELGDIIPVGKWVLQTVCKQMKAWQNAGVFINRASVNVSPVQFRDKGFVQDVKDILEETGLAPTNLELEITEGMILPTSKASNTLQQLRNLGVYISIDDFGTGYSSLSYLKNLPINTLKIDKSFIRELNTDEEVIVDTIINLGKNLNFNVLAEGIEKEEQLTYLKSQDCHEGQGYYWSKPVGADEMVKIYQRSIG